LEITDIKISLRNDGLLKGFANITFDNAFVVKGLKIIDNGQRMFVSMPSRKLGDGRYQDIAHPINSQTRAMIESAVLEYYRKKLAECDETSAISGPDD
jgi:stage V sporulation protein G